jgi:hypothetical protein
MKLLKGNASLELLGEEAEAAELGVERVNGLFDLGQRRSENENRRGRMKSRGKFQ